MKPIAKREKLRLKSEVNMKLIFSKWSRQLAHDCVQCINSPPNGNEN